MKKETRGRKPSPDKKLTVCLYIETSKIEKAGGMEKMKERLYASVDGVNWVAVTDKMPPRPDEDYLVVVRNKNKEGGIPIQDIQQYTSGGVFVGGSVDVWERVVYWAELINPPF